MNSLKILEKIEQNKLNDRNYDASYKVYTGLNTSVE